MAKTAEKKVTAKFDSLNDERPGWFWKSELVGNFTVGKLPKSKFDIEQLEDAQESAPDAKLVLITFSGYAKPTNFDGETHGKNGYRWSCPAGVAEFEGEKIYCGIPYNFLRRRR